MDSQGTDRRRAPRASYSVTAVVYLENERFTARVLNLSASGMLVIPPVDAELGTSVHLNLTLPGLDQIIDADGVVAREELVEGYRAWGIALRDPSEETKALLNAYVDWACQREVHEAATLPPVAPVSPPAALERTKTGPAHELIMAPNGSARLGGGAPAPGAGGPLMRRPTDPNLGPVELEEPDLLVELRDLYRDTLQRLRDGSASAAEEGVKRKKGWFR